MINRCRSPDQNLGTTFSKILTRGGVEAWPRLFQNLRASREPELMAQHPAKDMASWLGNSVPTAMKHYAMATEAAFKAASDPAGSTVVSVAGSGGSIAGVYGAIEQEEENASTTECHPETPRIAGESDFSIVLDSGGAFYLIGQAGLEPATKAL